MEFDDFAQPEVGLAVAITAVATSPGIRKTLRRGAAYGIAGVLLAGDSAQRFVNAVAKGARHAVHARPADPALTASAQEVSSGS
jgi:hypothetical protein